MRRSTILKKVPRLHDTLCNPLKGLSESFLLFSQALPSQDLGFVDAKAETIDFAVGGRDIIIRQSPALLSSSRSEGTTGAVLWRVSHLFAEWVSSPGNCLFSHSVLTPTSSVLELGCGITGLLALALATRIRSYVATDQAYLLKVLKQNIKDNPIKPKGVKTSHNTEIYTKTAIKHPIVDTNIDVIALDWELNSVTTLPMLLESFDAVDAVIGCDCVYNEALVGPFVMTCRDICSLQSLMGRQNPTVCIVAQQLRSPDVFEMWAKVFYSYFRFWRLPDELLSEGLQSNSGFVVHLGILRNSTLSDAGDYTFPN